MQEMKTAAKEELSKLWMYRDPLVRPTLARVTYIKRLHACCESCLLGGGGGGGDSARGGEGAPMHVTSTHDEYLHSGGADAAALALLSNTLLPRPADEEASKGLLRDAQGPQLEVTFPAVASSY